MNIVVVIIYLLKIWTGKPNGYIIITFKYVVVILTYIFRYKTTKQQKCIVNYIET